MASQRNIICHDDVITNVVVMGDVRPDHDKAIVPDHCKAAKFGHARMGGCILTKDAVLTDNQSRVRCRFKPYNLRHTTQYRMRVQDTPLPQFCVTGHDRMRHQDGISPNACVWTNMTEWPDNDTITESGSVLNVGSGMNLCGHEFPKAAGTR